MLFYLYLFDTNVTSIPDCIVQMNSLQVLELDGTSITTIPASVTQLPAVNNFVSKCVCIFWFYLCNGDSMSGHLCV